MFVAQRRRIAVLDLIEDVCGRHDAFEPDACFDGRVAGTARVQVRRQQETRPSQAAPDLPVLATQRFDQDIAKWPSGRRRADYPWRGGARRPQRVLQYT